MVAWRRSLAHGYIYAAIRLWSRVLQHYFLLTGSQIVSTEAFNFPESYIIFGAIDLCNRGHIPVLDLRYPTAAADNARIFVRVASEHLNWVK